MCYLPLSSTQQYLFKVLWILVLISFPRYVCCQNFDNFLTRSRSELTCSEVEDFEGIIAQAYTTVADSGLLFGEAFEGNKVEATPFGDLVAHYASNPLNITGGQTDESLQVVANAAFPGITSNAICGVGSSALISPVGNGALAILFDVPQTEVAFDVVLLGDHGLIEVDFKATTGESVEVYSYDDNNQIPSEAAYTQSAIAIDLGVTFSGLLIYTAQGGGLCIDNIQFCVDSTNNTRNLRGT